MDNDANEGFFALIKSLWKKRAPLDNSEDLTEEIHGLMDEGQARGFISDEESHMVYGVLDLKGKKAHSIMVPRTEISSAPQKSSLGEAIQLINHCGHTRIPIHRENVDQIVGILNAKDLLKLWGKDPEFPIPTEILRKPFFVPETQNVTDVLKLLKERKTHLAIVTDEYGGTAGIITIEDILEEIVGEIMDEHDSEEDLITLNEDGSLLVDARLEVGKLEEYLGMCVPKGEFESVGGLIIHLLGRIPRINEKIQFEPLEIIVQKADQRKIDKVLIVRRPEPPSLDESGQDKAGEREQPRS